MLKKRFGQHFLTDTNILQRIVRFAAIQPGDDVVEIGPGAGGLTQELARCARQVIAIEVDPDLIGPLRETVPANVTIIEADALQIEFDKVAAHRVHMVGNLPYNIATPLFKRFIEFRRSIIDVTVMIQKEVAERIVAKPNDEAYGPLSVLIQYYATPKYGFTVPPGAFRPKPKVDSAVIRLDWRPNIETAHKFTDFVQRAFSERRKKLINNLGRMLEGISRQKLIEQMRQAGIPADARPENLSVDEFVRLYNQICGN